MRQWATMLPSVPSLDIFRRTRGLPGQDATTSTAMQCASLMNRCSLSSSSWHAFLHRERHLLTILLTKRTCLGKLRLLPAGMLHDAHHCHGLQLPHRKVLPVLASHSGHALTLHLTSQQLTSPHIINALLCERNLLPGRITHSICRILRHSKAPQNASSHRTSDASDLISHRVEWVLQGSQCLLGALLVGGKKLPPHRFLLLVVRGASKGTRRTRGEGGGLVEEHIDEEVGLNLQAAAISAVHLQGNEVRCGERVIGGRGGAKRGGRWHC